MKNVKKHVSTLPLSLRGKKRYVLFRIAPGEKLDKSSVEKGLFHHFLLSFGVLGLPLLRYRFISYNASNGRGVFRVAHIKAAESIVSLSLVDSLHSLPVSIRSLRVSGSLKSLRPLFLQKQ
ncbi:MAG: Rpp14/Pop5 family protein [archaeon]